MFSLPTLALLFATLPTPQAAPARATAVRTLTVTARDYAFDVADTVAAGPTEIRLLNKGNELHHASLIRLAGGHTAAQFLAALKGGGPPPAWAIDAGGPNAPVPGGTSAAIVDLRAGTYMLVCYIPSADGQPHFMKGMVRAFTVVDAAKMKHPGATKTEAAPDVTVTLSDYAFTFSKPLTAGHHVVRLANAATQTHEMYMVRTAPGKTAKDVAAWVEKMQGPPPAEPLGGVSGLAKGETNDIAIDLTPGNYALLCFVPDAKDGKPHVMHGMLRDIVVK